MYRKYLKQNNLTLQDMTVKDYWINVLKCEYKRKRNFTVEELGGYNAYMRLYNKYNRIKKMNLDFEPFKSLTFSKFVVDWKALYRQALDVKRQERIERCKIV
jgi:hypothetical protein